MRSDIRDETTSTDTLSVMRSIVRRMNGFLYRCHNDADFTMMFMEGAVERVTGYDRDAFVGTERRSYAGIIHPDDVATVDNAVAAAVETRSNWEVDYRIMRADGSEQWVHESGGGVYGPDGKLSHLEGVVIDVNSKKTRELENSAVLLARVGQTSQEIIANTGAILRILQTLQLLALNARIEAARAGEYVQGSRSSRQKSRLWLTRVAHRRSASPDCQRSCRAFCGRRRKAKVVPERGFMHRSENHYSVQRYRWAFKSNHSRAAAFMRLSGDPACRPARDRVTASTESA